MIIKLPIFFHTDESLQKEQLGITDKTIDTDFEIRDMLFLNITAIAPYYDDDSKKVEYCSIYANGERFICNATFEKVQEKIMEALLLESEYK